MNIKNMFIVIAGTVADGHCPIRNSDVTVHTNHSEALEAAKSRIDRRAYNHVIIYQAMTCVQRTAPPTTVCDIKADGEVTCE